MATNDYSKMGKEELRKACKAAGVAYGKLNNDGMRAALVKFDAELESKESNNKFHTTDAKVVAEQTAEATAQNEVKSEPAQAPQVPAEVASVVAAVVREQVVGHVPAPKSLKIEKDRDARNGVKRPSAGSICRAVWDALDAHVKANDGASPKFEDVRALMKTNNWQRNTAFTQFQRWKQFNGVMPRSTEGQDEGAVEVQDENTDLHDDSGEE